MKFIPRICMLALFIVMAGTASAAPAYWRVDGDNGTLYILGTMHRLPAGQDWFSEDLKAIARSSKAIVLETESTQAAEDYLGFLIQQNGLIISRKHLAREIGEENFQAFQSLMEGFGYANGPLERYRPWYAAILLGRLGGEEAGYFIDYGVEAVLENLASEENIPLLGLETIPQQFLFFADMPKETQVTMLRTTLDQSNDFPARYDSQFNAWIEGNTKTTADLVLTPLREDPLLYDTLILNRNKAWAEKFEYFMEGGGTYFIAVGTGHLVGPESVLKMLEDKGYQVTRQ